MSSSLHPQLAEVTGDVAAAAAAAAGEDKDKRREEILRAELEDMILVEHQQSNANRQQQLAST